MRLEHWSPIVFATAVLALTPLPGAADVVTTSVEDFFSEAGSASVDFVVNPDGSVSGPTSSAFGGWEVDVTGQCAPHICVPLLDVPSLPPGSTLNSATFTFDVTVGVQEIFANTSYSVEGSLATQFVFGSPCGDLSAPFPPGNTCSFPGSTLEQIYSPDLLGGFGATLVAGVPPDLEPGEYFAAVNLPVTADLTVTEDYSTTPEPRTYAFPIGLALVGLFTIRNRARHKVS